MCEFTCCVCVNSVKKMYGKSICMHARDLEDGETCNMRFMFMHTYIHICMHTRMRTYIYIYLYVLMRTNVYVATHRYMHIHTYTHRSMHTYLHTHTHIILCREKSRADKAEEQGKDALKKIADLTVSNLV